MPYHRSLFHLARYITSPYVVGVTVSQPPIGLCYGDVTRPLSACYGEPLPTTRAFGDYLKNIALQGSFHDIITALLCAEWLYLDWSQRLIKSIPSPAQRGKVRKGVQPLNPFYRQWIDIHAGDELSTFVAWMRRTLDSAPNPNIPRLRRIFRDTLRYEYLFFQMAYNGESWPA